MKIKRIYEDVNDEPVCLKNDEPQCNYCDATDETCLEWKCHIFGELGESDAFGDIYACEECLEARKKENLKRKDV